MKIHRYSRYLAMIVSVLTVTAAAGAAPGIINYQGRIEVNGQPFGATTPQTGYFHFAIVDASQGVWSQLYWSNDGNNPPTTDVAVTVDHGLYNVVLGDTSLTGMTQAIAASVFTHEALYLAVWFNDGVNGSILLSPYQRLASTGYALQAADVRGQAIQPASVAIAGYGQVINSSGQWVGESTGFSGVPAGYMILGSTTTAPPGYTYTGLTIESSDTGAGNYWTARAHLSVARRYLAAAETGGKVYAIGGYNYQLSNSPLSTNEEYDPALNVWTTKTSMPTARFYLAAAAGGGKVYAIGGYDSSYYIIAKNEEYDPATDTWTTKASMPIGRDQHAAVGVNGKVYAIGGYSSSYYIIANCDEYDPTLDQWVAKPDMPTARYSLGAATCNGKIYAVGGIQSSGVTGANEVYDPALDTWSTRAAKPTALAWLSVAEAGGKIYAMGGGNWSYYSSVLNEEYDPGDNTWATRADMNEPRGYHAAATVNNKIYAIAGMDPSWHELDTLSEFTPPSGMEKQTFYVHRKN